MKMDISPTVEKSCGDKKQRASMVWTISSTMAVPPFSIKRQKNPARTVPFIFGFSEILFSIMISFRKYSFAL